MLFVYVEMTMLQSVQIMISQLFDFVCPVQFIGLQVKLEMECRTKHWTEIEGTTTLFREEKAQVVMKYYYRVKNLA